MGGKLKRTTYVILFGGALLSGCSKPTETVIPADPQKWDTQLAPAIKKLPEEDRKAVTAYLMRVKLGEAFGKEGLPIGTTVGDAIRMQNEWQTAEEKRAAEAAELKQRIQKEQIASREAIDKAVTVSFISKREVPRNIHSGRYSDTQEFTIAILNKSDRAIVGVSGQFFFIDVFGKDVGSMSFGVSETIKPGATYQWTGVRDYNQFIDSHRALWDLQEGKFTTRFVPESVVYADGTKVEAARR